MVHAISTIPTSPLDENQKSALTKYFNGVLPGNTRYDQKDSCDEFPEPVGVSPLKNLSIVVTMEKAITDDANIIKQFQRGTDGKHWVPKAGEPWHEYEKACLIEEMAELARAGGFNHKKMSSSSGGGNIFKYLSRSLNLHYGIDRSENSIKNTWYRELRARSGIDERAGFRAPGKDTSRLSANLRVSLPNRGRNAKRRQKGTKTALGVKAEARAVKRSARK
jgi:hypothetical protein